MEVTCQAFKHALRQNTGLRTVYLHFRQTQAALPKLYGVILAKICGKKFVTFEFIGQYSCPIVYVHGTFI